MMATKKPTTITEYIRQYPPEVRNKLKQIRQAVAKAVPDAGETIKYSIPTFTLNGNMLSFAAYKNHIGFYPIPPVSAAFKKQLAPYQAAKSTLQFPLDKPLPIALIRRVALASARRMRHRAKKTS